MKLEEIIKNQDINALQKIIDEGMNISNIRLLAILDLVKDPNLEFLQLLIENGVDIDSEGSIEDTKYMFSFIQDALKSKEKLWTRPQGYNREWSTMILNKLKKFTYNFNDNAYMTRYRLGIYIIGRLKNEVREKKLSLEKIQNEYLTKEIYYRYSSLMFAIEKQNIKLVKFLIKNGADINLYDCFIGRTPLHYAIETKDSGLIKLLIENGADVNKVDYLRFNPLSVAIDKDLDIEIIDFIINNGASLYPYSNLNFSKSNEKLFRGFYLKSQWNANIIIYAPDDNSTILMRAIMKDNYELVKLLIKKGIHLDTQNKFGDTALIITSVQGNYDISKLLVDAGASIEIENSKGLNAIDVANDKIKEMLFKKVSNTYKNKPKEKNVRKRTKTKYLNSPTFRNKLNKKNINLQDSNGKTRLIRSCEDGNLDEIKECIELNADRSIKDNEGYTVLDYASFSDNFEEIRKLLILVDGKHSPKKLSELLNKFSSNKKLKYSNHTWDSSLNYNDFIKDLREGFSEIKDDLKILSSDLYQDIHSFLFDKNAIGWSSKIIKEEIIKGTLPHNISLDTSNQPFKTFGDAIDNFKGLFVVKQNDKKLKLLKKFTKIKKELALKNIDLSDLKQDKVDKFFTDTKRFEKALTLILKDIQENSNDDKKDIVIEANTIFVNGMDMIEIKIIHIGSTSPKTAEALKETIDKNGGNFQTIYNNLLSVCDWSIDTICQDKKRYRIDYLYPEIDNIKPHCTQIDDESRGFTHILRFYV